MLTEMLMDKVDVGEVSMARTIVSCFNNSFYRLLIFPIA